MDDQDATLDAIEVRRAGSDDLHPIIELGRTALGWSVDADAADRFRWKHLLNPFGTSPMWVATDSGRIVGLRAFLRWELIDHQGQRVHAVRPVDTATDPAYQGRGIFTRLTTGALDDLRADEVELVFNTPNASSLPGYLKMGWSRVGRLPVALMLRGAGSAPALATARQPASRSSIPTSVGESAAEVLADHAEIRELLPTLPSPNGLRTARSPEHLSWRYGHEPLHYRAMLRGPSPSDGLVIFRLRRRGRAVEAALCEVLVPSDDLHAARSLLRRVLRETKATYLLELAGPQTSRARLRVPGAGPILASRRLDGEPPPGRRHWALGLGDVELL